MHIKTKIAGALMLAVLMVPGISFAQTQSTADLYALIASLTAQVQQLEAQLAAQTGGSTQWCHAFNTNLSIGMSGSEVTALQTALQKDGESVTVSGTFDDQTASAVSGFQQKYTSTILAPNGLSNGTGYAGAATRGELNALFGCGTNPTSTPVSPAVSSIQVNSPSAGQSFSNGSTMNIQWTPASVGVALISLVPTNGGGSYQIYGMKVQGNPTTYSGSYSYAISGVAAGTYYVKVYSALDSIGNGTGVTGQSGVVTITAPSAQTPTITVLSPNGGTLTSGTTYNITYSSSYPTNDEPETGVALYQGNTLIGYPVTTSVGTDNLSWNVGQYTVNGSGVPQTAPAGSNYFIQVYMAGGAKGSSVPFSIVAAQVADPVINSFSVGAGPTFSLSAYNYNTITFQAQCGNFVAVVQPQNGSPASYPSGSASICNAPQTYSSSSFNETSNISPQMVNVPLSLYNAQGVVDGSITLIGSPAGSNNNGSATLTVNVCNSAGVCVQRTASFPIYAKG